VKRKTATKPATKVTHTPTTRLEMEQEFKSLFNTPLGRTVLKYLNDRYYDNKFTDENIDRQVGRRDVMQDINSHLRDRNE